MKARQKNKQAYKFNSKCKSDLVNYKPDYSHVIEQWKSIMYNNFKVYGSYFIDEISEFSPDQIAALTRLTKYSQEVGLYDN